MPASILLTSSPPVPLLTSLVLHEVVPTAQWSADLSLLSLTLGYTDFCLLEKVPVVLADALLRVAATLAPPLTGAIRHWGRDLSTLARRQLYPWRRRLAFVSPEHALLPRLTLAENLSLPQLLLSKRRALGGGPLPPHLVARLGLSPYLSSYPRDLPPRQYQLALWARELVKEPRLILGVLAGREAPHGAPALAPVLLPILEEYHRQRRGAILLAGPWLEVAYPLADRLIQAQGPAWQEYALPRRHGHPLPSYLRVI